MLLCWFALVFFFIIGTHGFSLSDHFNLLPFLTFQCLCVWLWLPVSMETYLVAHLYRMCVCMRACEFIRLFIAVHLPAERTFACLKCSVEAVRPSCPRAPPMLLHQLSLEAHRRTAHACVPWLLTHTQIYPHAQSSTSSSTASFDVVLKSLMSLQRQMVSREARSVCTC